MKAHRRSATLNNSPLMLEKINENTKPTLLKKLSQKFNFSNNNLQYCDLSSESKMKINKINKTINYEIGTIFFAIKKKESNDEQELNFNIGDEIKYIGNTPKNQPIGQIIKNGNSIVGIFSFNKVKTINEFNINERKKNKQYPKFSTLKKNSNSSDIKFRHSATTFNSKVSVFQLLNENFQNKNSNDQIIENKKKFGHARSASQGWFQQDISIKSDDFERLNKSFFDQSDKFDKSSISTNLNNENSNIDISKYDINSLSKEIYMSFYIERRTTFEKIKLHIDEPTFNKISSMSFNNINVS